MKILRTEMTFQQSLLDNKLIQCYSWFTSVVACTCN